MKTQIFNSLLFSLRFAFVLVTILCVYSCANPPSHEPPEEIENTESAEELAEGEDGEYFEKEVKELINSDSMTAKVAFRLEEYKVVLDVTKTIKTYKTGEFRVWIGAEKYMSEKREDIARDITTVPNTLGQFAKITPYAPDFDIKPEKSECIRIHPSGSSVRFTLIPLKQGAFEVSAVVELFEGVDCSGTPIPKSSETLTVLVEVDNKYLFLDKSKELLSILWEKFLSFWGALITLLFALIIYLIRRKIRQKTGFDEKQEKP